MRTAPALLMIVVITCSLLFSCTHNQQEPTVPATDADLNDAAYPDRYREVFEKRVENVCDGVYVAIGYALANSVMVTVDGGKVIIDTTESVAAAAEIRERFDEIEPGPVKAIIYTHTHPDHILGTSVFWEPGVPVYAHAESIQHLNDRLSSLGDTTRYRASKQFGETLDDGLRKMNGIGPFLRMDEGPVPPIIYPTHTFRGIESISIGNVTFELHEAPGETHDQIFIWLPEKKVLIPGDNVYMAFPNLYSTRGVPPRPVRGWIRSLDEMRSLQPEYLVPCHTQPVVGAQQIQDVLTVYRDAIRFLHDSVIRMANEGKTPDDMVRDIELPPHLRDHPYLQEFYGEVPWSVRGIYDGYLGWFDGNPSNLNRLHPQERALRIIPLLGGRDAILLQIRSAIDVHDMQWAAELSDILLAQDPDDSDARSLKAEALWALGMEETNPNARCFMLSSALELQGRYDDPGKPIIDRETLRDFPIEVLIRTFPERLKPDKTADVDKAIGFQFTDTDRCFTLKIRNGVGEVTKQKAADPDLEFISTEDEFKAFIIGDTSPAKALATGQVRVEGGLGELLAFKSYLIEP